MLLALLKADAKEVLLDDREDSGRMSVSTLSDTPIA